MTKSVEPISIGYKLINGFVMMNSDHILHVKSLLSEDDYAKFDDNFYTVMKTVVAKMDYEVVSHNDFDKFYQTVLNAIHDL